MLRGDNLWPEQTCGQARIDHRRHYGHWVGDGATILERARGWGLRTRKKLGGDVRVVWSDADSVAAQAVLPVFADPASIVLTTSINAHIGMANRAFMARPKRR